MKTGDFLFGWILREECKKGVFFIVTKCVDKIVIALSSTCVSLAVTPRVRIR